MGPMRRHRSAERCGHAHAHFGAPCTQGADTQLRACTGSPWPRHAASWLVDTWWHVKLRTSSWCPESLAQCSYVPVAPHQCQVHVLQQHRHVCDTHMHMCANRTMRCSTATHLRRPRSKFSVMFVCALCDEGSSAAKPLLHEQLQETMLLLHPQVVFRTFHHRHCYLVTATVHPRNLSSLAACLVNCMSMASELIALTCTSCYAVMLHQRCSGLARDANRGSKCCRSQVNSNGV